MFLIMLPIMCLDLYCKTCALIESNRIPHSCSIVRNSKEYAIQLFAGYLFIKSLVALRFEEREELAQPANVSIAGVVGMLRRVLQKKGLFKSISI